MRVMNAVLDRADAQLLARREPSHML